MIPQSGAQYNTSRKGYSPAPMHAIRKAGWLALLGCAISFGARVRGVRVENPGGNITARLTPSDRVTYQITPTESKGNCDLVVAQPSEILVIRCKPEGPPAEVVVDLPFGALFEAVSHTGSISFTGLAPNVRLSTESGDVRITAPWSLMRLLVVSQTKPKSFSTPRGVTFRSNTEDGQWVLGQPNLRPRYGDIRVNTVSPGRIEVADMPVPEYSTVKAPSEAPAVLEAWRKLGPRMEPASAGKAEVQTGPATPTARDGTPVFTTDVRMVSLSVAAEDRAGGAVTGLRRGEFEILEDGERQNIAVLGAEEVPFNLVLLLDLSGSTRGEREAMKEAARRFVGIARPYDRVAVYALANSLFYVISPLTSNHQRLLDEVQAIPEVEGDTPLYDMIVLSCAQELLQHPDERNALIVISDGVDNALSSYINAGGSEVSFGRLRSAVATMPLLIYPVIVGTTENPGLARDAARNMRALAQASGGRVFEAQSIMELAPIYPQVAAELRSVYTLAYYPTNQNFDGKWRRVEVRVLRGGVNVRTRTGYFAR